jgi:hypothetical protein
MPVITCLHRNVDQAQIGMQSQSFQAYHQQSVSIEEFNKLILSYPILLFPPKKESYKDNKQLTFSIVLESFLATLEFKGLELGFELFLFPLLSNIAGLSPKMLSFRFSIRVPKTLRSSQIPICNSYR